MINDASQGRLVSTEELFAVLQEIEGILIREKLCLFDVQAIMVMILGKSYAQLPTAEEAVDAIVNGTMPSLLEYVQSVFEGRPQRNLSNLPSAGSA